MPEVPEESIEEAERDPVARDHDHDGVAADDGSLGAHLAVTHGLAEGEGLSPSTQEGLHDRVHRSSKAADD